MLFDCAGRPALLRQRHVEKRFLRHLFVRPGRIHRCRSQSAHERRRLLHDRQHRRWNRHDVMRRDIIAQAAQRVAKRFAAVCPPRDGPSPLASRICCGVLAGSIFFAVSRNACLVLPQILVADLEQSVERNIHHLVVEQLLPVVLRADPEIALRARQQVVFQKRLIALELPNHCRVGLMKRIEQRTVFHGTERQRHVFLKEADDARQLLDRDLRIDARRILQILARGFEYLRHLPFARDHRLQALALRSEIAAHDHEDGVAGRARIAIRILFPAADRFDVEQ